MGALWAVINRPNCLLASRSTSPHCSVFSSSLSSAIELTTDARTPCACAQLYTVTPVNRMAKISIAVGNRYFIFSALYDRVCGAMHERPHHP